MFRDFVRSRSICMLTAFCLAASWGGGVLAQCELEAGDSLFAGDATSFDQFGRSVALDGEVAVVGVEGDDTAAGTNGGSAWVLRRTAGTWEIEQQLLPSRGNAFAAFGRAVAVAGDWVLVGAPADDTAGDGAGAVFVFRFDGDEWVEDDRLTAADADDGDRFGQSLAMTARRAVIGADFDDEAADDAGAAYIYNLVADEWTESDKLAASDADTDHGFGGAVAISGNRVLIGAEYDDTLGSDSGAAYAFLLVDGDWVEEDKLLPEEGDPSDFFGDAVGLSGPLALVGANSEDDGGSNAGAAYIFRLQSGNWTQTQRLMPSDPGEQDFFGISVSLSGTQALIGASGDDEAASSAGAAYLFRLEGDTWEEVQKLLPAEGTDLDLFGEALVLRGDDAFIGTMNEDEVDTNAGAVTHYSLTGAGCVQFVRADCNVDGTVNLVDATFLLNYITGSGSVPDCRQACEINSDGTLNLADPVYLLSHLFLNGTPPAPPYPTCGAAAKDEELGCNEFSECGP